MTGDALRFESFSCRHPGAQAPALREVDLVFARGEMVVVAGPSGSGKSTLLRAAAGLMPNFDGGTAAGRVVTGGLDTRANGPGEIGRVCGLVMQDAERQAVMATPRGEIALPLESRGFSVTAIARAVEESALLTGVEGLLDRKLSTLSGGELQRVAVAAALAAGSGILLLDEPTSQLDPVAADGLVWLLRRVNEEQGITVVIAEQRLERLLPAADRVVVLNEGRVACDESPEEFLEWAAGRSPALQTPAGLLFEKAGLPAPPTTVKGARAALAERGLLPAGVVALEAGTTRPAGTAAARRGPTVRVRGVWDEPKGARPLLAGVDLEASRGETVALMGRNGAGKSTLLRQLAGLRRPTRGRIETDGELAMLTQDASNCLIAPSLGELFDAEELAAAGIACDPSRSPRDLSGGERQWLAFEIVMRAVGDRGVVLLDEPTRGLDRARRGDLGARISCAAEEGSTLILATHDAELAAEVADRIVLLAEGRVITSGTPREVLSGGWHFTTETSRILGGDSGALLPAEGADLLRGRGRVAR